MKPRLLDLFAGAGGATRGYQLAGFHVTGVDIEDQPNYVGDEFHRADAMAFPLDGFDAIHASPVCYAWSQMRLCRPGSRDDQPDLITPLRPRLQAAGVPYVIENVPGAPLINPVQICGSGLGLRLQRHRLFESNVPLWGVPCAHGQNPWNEAYGHSTGRKRRRVPVIGEWRIRPELQREAMQVDWMTLEELTEAIPPGLHAAHRRTTALGSGGGGVIFPERDRHWPIPLSAVSSIPCQYPDGRFVVAHAAKELPGGTFSPVGVALAKAVVEHSNACAQNGKVPAQEVVPAQCDLPGTVANTYVGGVSDG